jgi:hypothetical protein
VNSQGAWVGGVVLMNGGVFKRMSKILFGNMVWLLFRWLSEVYSAYIHSFIFPPYGYIVTWDSSVNNLHNQYEELSISLGTRFKSITVFKCNRIQYRGGTNFHSV